MTAILNRTVFYNETNGIKSFWDWSLTTTNLGVMAEPFIVNDRIGRAHIIEFDATDECSRIDEIRAMPIDAQQLVLSGGTDHLHGGATLSRTGK